MFGFHFIKFDAMTYVIRHTNGKISQEGSGLSFFYYGPVTSITAIPLGSRDIQFIFEEITSDYQTVTVQGRITYRISDPKTMSQALDFTLNDDKKYKEDNFAKIEQRLENETQASVSSYIQDLDLRTAIRSSAAICEHIRKKMQNSDGTRLLGVEILSADVLGITPAPEMAKAMETSTREALQKEADKAIYERRDFAVEQERRIRENELNTEIAVQEKNKQIHTKKAEIELQKAESERQLREMNMQTEIAIEEQNLKLIEMRSENIRKSAEAEGYAIQQRLSPLKDIDWRVLTALQGTSGTASDNISLAIRELAENAEKIGTLNVTPDLLQSLIDQKKK